MNERPAPISRAISRRTILAAAATAAASPAFAQQQECRLGPPPHHQGPPVFLNYDQLELDASYDQSYYEPLIGQVGRRLAGLSEATRSRLGAPHRAAYGPSEIEKLDIYATRRARAPIFVFIHGGTWRRGAAKDYAFPAEMFVNAGAHYVALDFAAVQDVGGDLTVLATQVRRGIAWVYRNAESFGGDAERLYIGGHSSGGHLCGVALVTDWQSEFGIPSTAVKRGLCMSGMYDTAPVRLSWRRSYLNLTDAMAEAMSPIRHLDKLAAPVVVTHGNLETPDFQRQSREFAAAVKAAGKPAQLIEAPYAHLEMAETLGNPYAVNGRAALAMMGLTPG
jgi:arylformamidase